MKPHAKRLIILALGLLLGVALLSSGVLVSAAGDLDNSFGRPSKVITPIGNGRLKGVTIQADGQSVAIGDTLGATRNFTLARFLLAPGSLSFSAANYSVNEGGGTANITLTRTGGTDNKVVAEVNLTDVTTSPADHGLSPGTVDPVFNQFPGFTINTGTNDTVSAIALQPDGKIVIGGSFTLCRAVARNHIARLNADGTLDTTFDPGTGADGSVYSIALQADGKIIIAGSFFHFNGASRRSIARLKPDGTLDATFTPDAVVNSPVSIALQPDGKIIAAGDLPVGSYAQPRVIRLNTDGSLDNTFNSGTGANDSLGIGALQPDGKIIIGGPFISYNGIARNHLARLNSDGSVDTTFNPVVDVNEHFSAILLQPDGKIMIGGDFTNTNGIRGVIRRINSDGSLDTSFNPGTGPNLSIYTAALQQDGKIIIGGNFTTYNGTSRTRIARLNPDGSLDTTFIPGLGASSPVLAMRVQDDGQIVIGGEFSDYNNAYRSHIARVEGDIFVTWPAGDASDKTIQLPIVDDSILEPNETLTLSLTPITGGATLGTNPTSTLTIIDNDSSITSVSGSGVYNGTATLTATLSSFSSKLSGKTVSFSRFGVTVGTATTDSNGVATLTGVSLAGINAGSYSIGIRASFAGDTNFSGSNNTGTLTVSKVTPVITWNNPPNITVGTPLTSTQLNATANVPGTFQYNPPAGTVFNSPGSYQLAVTFTPTDAVNYQTVAASVQVTVDPVPPAAITFSSQGYTVNESSGNVAVTINRTGDTSHAITVDYATNDTAGLAPCNVFNGVASSRCDYATTVGSLQFAAGETTKTIFIPIVNDSYAEGLESFNITLSNPSGAALGSISTATVTIIDDDSTTGGNPIVDPSFFVRQQYIDFLGREPDPAGLAGWLDVLNNCGTKYQTPCDRIEVSAGFFRSPEFQDRGYFVFRFYPVALGRSPFYSEFMPDLAKVSGFLTDAQLEAAKVAFIQDFMSRQEFQNRYGSLGDQAFHDAIVQTAGIDPGIAFPNGTMTRAQFLRSFVDSTAVYNKFYNQSFVVMQYFGYLRRDPDVLYLNWIDTMNKNGGDYRTMINGFMNSSEYFLRFGP